MQNLMRVNPNDIFPNKELKNMCFIKNVIKSPNIFIGDYTYYDDPIDSTKFEQNNVLFNWPEFGDCLRIGKFCAIAYGAQFLMGSANHRMSSVTTYPFNVFGADWAQNTPPHLAQLPRKGDIEIGNDVWIGRDCLIMPGVKIGNGAIIAARSVVANDIAPYTIAGGNPSKPIKKRFDDAFIAILQAFAWWDLAADQLAQWLPILCADTEQARGALQDALHKRQEKQNGQEKPL